MARARKRLVKSLREDIVRSRPQRVDRKAGIIYGVKVLGLESLNGRRYTPAAIRQAVSMYEGKGVFVDHPAKPGDPRKVLDRFGWLESVRVGDDGCLYGDLHILLPESEQADLVMAAAEKKPDLFGLSHNAQGAGEERDGVFVVEEITEVRSVDVVTEPATTGGLFEGRRPMAITIKQLFEASWKKAYVKKVTKRPRLAAVCKRLIEDDDYGVMDEPAEGMEEAPADHEEALKSGFEASVSAIVKKCLDGEEEPKESIQKISELLKAHDKLAGGDDEASDDLEEEDEEPRKKEEEGEERAKKEEAEEQLRRLKAKDEARDLCEDMGVACDKVLLEALMGLPDKAARKRLLEREKSKGGRQAPAGNPPRSGAGGKTTQTTLEGVDTPEGAMAALLG